MPARPNILFLMTDQMQGRVLEPSHPCQTPNLARLAAMGVRFRRAYTPNPVCSPARASLMTGLLPHNHGVLEVTHVVDDDQCCLRTEKPHWAQRLAELGFRTGYFGKWHVERSNDLRRFGWQIDGGAAGPLYREHRTRVLAGRSRSPRYALARYLDDPPGYRRELLYAVTDQPAEARNMGITTSLALEFLQGALAGDQPWCCFVSVTEPHDPFVCGREAFGRYDVNAIELPPNAYDNLEGRPALYRKAARTWAGLTEREKREAALCYYATITEIDEQFGRLIRLVEEAGQLDHTIVVVTSDHGELLGAHGLYCKNFSAYEEVYNIPLIVAGPGIAQGAVTNARVGLHDLCPTLLELVGAEPIPTAPDSRSFAPVLRDTAGHEAAFQTGYAESYGGRYRLTQRVIWQGPWKFALNGFDFDELYHLQEDPYEMRNLADDPACASRVRELMAGIWRMVRETDDHALWDSHYPILRLAPYGPLVAQEPEA